VFRPAAELTFEERREHLRKFLESHAGNTVVLTDEAMERESIYGDRGL
jgi:predicted double-glycine peptidase